MNFFELIQQVRTNTLDVSVPSFMPELVLTVTVVLLLLLRLPNFLRRLDGFWIALVGAIVAMYFAAPWKFLTGAETLGRVEIFDGLLVYDTMTVFFRSLLVLFAILFIIFTKFSGIPDRDDAPDFYTLVLGATVGMCMMASANSLFMVFLAVEMASVPSYVLAGMLKGRRESSEAALKYSVYGAGTAGVMLYGISLLAGSLGTLHLPTIAQVLTDMPVDVFAERQGVLMLGGLMLMVGLAFKLSAVPFHFWCPDVFEGASAEVNAFLSVASKAAALALLIRVAVGFGQLPPTETPTTPVAAVAQTPVVLASYAAPVHEDHAAPATAAPDNLAKVRHFMLGLLVLLAAVTCTFGNLAAYGQTNIKRLLAYSTIAHAGYMMMPVAAAVYFIGRDDGLARAAVAAVCLYTGMYLFMNLGAFMVVAFLRNAMRSEQIADYGGLIRRHPGIVICLSIILLSLLGLPPLSGFAAKFSAFRVLAADRDAHLLLILLVVGGLNTVISLFYYLRVVKVMTIDPEPADRLPVEFSLWTPAGVFLVLVTLPVVVLGVWVEPLSRWASTAAGAVLP